MDTFNVVRFGNDQCAFFSACVEAKGRSLRNARTAIDELAADMGGTEMGAALDYAYALKDAEGERPAAILLITDGQSTTSPEPHDTMEAITNIGNRTCKAARG